MSLSLAENSLTSGNSIFARRGISTFDIVSNIPIWFSSEACVRIPRLSRRFSYTASSLLLSTPSESIAPDFMSISSARLFKSVFEVRSMKSSMSANSPPLSLSDMSCSTSPPPIFFIAVSPKRIEPFSTWNEPRLLFISGGSIFIPCFAQSAIYSESLSADDRTEVKSALSYSLG